MVGCTTKGEHGVQIDFPLLPILIDVRWRPLRPFQWSVRGMMFAVGVAGLVFSLGAYALRLVEAGNQRAYKYALEPTGLNSSLHAGMRDRYQHSGLVLAMTFWVCL